MYTLIGVIADVHAVFRHMGRMMGIDRTAEQRQADYAIENMSTSGCLIGNGQSAGRIGKIQPGLHRLFHAGHRTLHRAERHLPGRLRLLETEWEIVFQTNLLRLPIDPNLRMQIGSIGAQGIAHTNTAAAQAEQNLQLLQNRPVLQSGHG